MEGLDESKAVMVVSDQYQEITEAILARLGRGVTMLNGQGRFSKVPTNVIYAVVSRLEITKMKSIH